MSTQNVDYRRYYVLYVDDEERSLKAFDRAYSDQFKILTAPNAAEGLRLLELHLDDVGVLITDQRMPGEKGVWLLDKARQLRPSMLRILATAYSDLEAVVNAVNTGAIFHYLNKPWDPPQLESTLKHALEIFSIRRERDELLREKMSVLHNKMISDRVVSLGFMAAGMSHHIRNKLQAVKTFIDLVPHHLQEEGVEPQQSKNPEFWTENMECAQRDLEKIDNLLKELWAVAETPALAFTDRVNFRDLAAETVHKLRDALATRRIAVAIDVPDTLPILTVDKVKFARMLELLITDEIVSLPDGSQIRISAEAGETAERVRISLRDDGPGLSPEILQGIFDPFSARSDSPGEHGINLMSCYFIIHYHSGKIDVRSAPGEGTQFVIDMPVTPTPSPVTADSTELLKKIRQTDQLWEKLLAAR